MIKREKHINIQKQSSFYGDVRKESLLYKLPEHFGEILNQGKCSNNHYILAESQRMFQKSAATRRVFQAEEIVCMEA